MFRRHQGTNIVRAPIKPRAIREVETYWEALRPEDDLPDRSAIRPEGLLNALNEAFVLERASPGVSRFRLAGQKLSGLLGIPAENVPFTALFSSVCQQNIAKSIEDVFSGPSVLRARLKSGGFIGRPTFVAHLIVLPLRGENRQIDRALGALWYDEPIGRTPRQFDDASIDMTRVVIRSEYPAKTSSFDIHGLSEPLQAVFSHKKRPENTGRPNLRVIEGFKA